VDLEVEKNEKRDSGAEWNDNMKLLEAVSIPANSANKTSYRSLSLVELIKKIVEESDRIGLEEFHSNRTIFNYRGKPPLLFIDYLNELREATARKTWIAPNPLEVAERAYDLTIEKFNNLPEIEEPSLPAKSKSRPSKKRKGTNCRFYFKAFLKYVARSFERRPPASQIEEEARAGKVGLWADPHAVPPWEWRKSCHR